eukprot:514226-Alexandrium_andersonii.AAC.1
MAQRLLARRAVLLYLMRHVQVLGGAPAPQTWLRRKVRRRRRRSRGLTPGSATTKAPKCEYRRPPEPLYP